MNLHAYHPADLTKTPTHIDEWVVKYGVSINGLCRICNTSMSVKADKSQKQTHFAQYRDSGCPTVVTNHIPYEAFRNLPRDPLVAESAKVWTLHNIENVYQKFKSFVTALTWKEMHGLKGDGSILIARGDGY